LLGAAHVQLKIGVTRLGPTLKPASTFSSTLDGSSVPYSLIEPSGSDEPQLLPRIGRTIRITPRGGTFEMVQLDRDAFGLLNHVTGRG
jgi:hypothetical protein